MVLSRAGDLCRVNCETALSLLRRFVRRPAAGIIGADRVDRRVALFNVRNLALLVDHKRRTIRHPGLLVQHPISGRCFPFGKIAEERNRDVVLGRELPLRGNVIGADAEDLCARRFKFSDTSLVRFEFRRSTTGKRCREERQHYCVFALEV